MKLVGFGLIGLGRISRAHRPGSRDATEYAVLVAVCDIDSDLAPLLARDLVCRPYRNYRELLADPEVQAVDLLLPHHLHYEVAKLAGKHDERPLTPSERKASELIQLSRMRGLLLSVAEDTRFVPGNMKAIRLVRSRALGVIRLVGTLIYGSSITWLNDATSWKRSRNVTIGGTISDAAPHSLYLLLGGNAPSRPSKTTSSNPKSKITAWLPAGCGRERPSPHRVQFQRPRFRKGERVEIYGSEGSLIVDQLVDPPSVRFREPNEMPGALVVGLRHCIGRWKDDSIARGVVAFARAGGKARRRWSIHTTATTSCPIERAYASVAVDGVLLGM